MKMRLSIDIEIDEKGVRLAPCAWSILGLPRRGMPPTAADAAAIAEQLLQLEPPSAPEVIPPEEALFDAPPAASTRGQRLCNVQLQAPPSAVQASAPLLAELMRIGCQPDRAKILITLHGQARVSKVLSWVRSKAATQPVNQPLALVESVLSKPA